ATSPFVSPSHCPFPAPGALSFISFLYVKEHIAKNKGSNAGDVSSSTQFVANAPTNGPIRRNLFLQSFFQRYAHGALVEKTRILQHLKQVMSAYEHTEAEVERRAKQLAEQPDEDGFITVTHRSSTPSFGATNDLEQQQHHEELKKKEMQDLKAGFEEDLETVKEMKEERAFRPV
ncbi:hypothetical protein HJC23_008591, partial [Cyclotella cryptica]